MIVTCINPNQQFQEIPQFPDDDDFRHSGVHKRCKVYSQTDTICLPTHTSVDNMTQTIQRLHLRDLLDYDEDVSSSDGPNDIDISRMLTGAVNHDYDICRSPYLQPQIKQIIHDHQKK